MTLFSKKALSTFNDLDYEIYHFVMKNSEKIVYMTIRELALETHVSTTTITRFCKKVGCNGFSEFKLKFKMFQEENNNINKSHDLSVIQDFFQRVNNETFQKMLKDISDIIVQKKQIIFLGFGNSGIIADYASRYFCNTGIFATSINSPFFPIILNDPENTVIVALSVEGEADMLLTNIQTLKQSKSTIISITNSNNSTLSKIADYNISYYIQKEDVSERNWINKIDITSQIPAIYIVETLAKLSINKSHDNRV